MSENISIPTSEILEIIKKYALGRFEFETEDVTTNNFLSGCPEGIDDKSVTRFRRSNQDAAHWKTFLIASIGSIEALKIGFKWAANVKDQLDTIEGSDLYLILALENETLTEDQIIGYESNELFCRKFFLRDGESVMQLIERTFLSSLNSSTESSDLSDPLYTALLNTAKGQPKFNDNQIALWKQEFLSGKSGIELIDAIFGPPLNSL